DPTLTGRTDIWNAVIREHTNPLVGVGYESFWLGPRLERVWQLAGHINEAHNGYLEVYLNMGGVGVVLLIALLISSYRTICKRLSSLYALATLNLAMWTLVLFYNVTEAAFKSGLLWMILLLGAIVIPERTEDRVRGVAAGENISAKKRFAESRLESAGPRRPSRSPSTINRLGS